MTPPASPVRDLLEAVRFNEAGLVPAIARDVATGRVLMLAWMNAESLQQTVATGYAHYWSRSRGRLWKKGERSGHLQRLERILLDCDGDTLLLDVHQTGPACHTNRPSCFYRAWHDDGWQTIEEPVE